ncbi:fibronectin type III domain protein [Dictyocaulus viviparus]|uniref:Fibronectin type III domain protein n=1 Tax=Dictyocaulus viviparus TaxID=29172 RepID=A0A0D8Y6X0_DICVI|nr:fibronectin type III domain protein [Dictyocaulus viviparus]
MVVLPFILFYTSKNYGEKEYTLTSSHEKHTVMALTPDTTYAFRVAAISARGQGEFSEPVLATTMQSAPTEAPYLLNVTAVSPTSLHVIWTTPNASENIVQYCIRYRVVTTENETSIDVNSSYEDDEAPSTNPPIWNNVHVNATNKMMNITGLLPFTVYEITVVAVTMHGFGPESNHIRRRTQDDGDNDHFLPVKKNYNLSYDKGAQIKFNMLSSI